MMKVRKDLTNQIFGRWKVICQVEDFIMPSGQHHPAWLCECQCDRKTRKTVNGYSLTRGDSQSCGCWGLENIKTINKRYNTFIEKEDYYIGITQTGKEFLFDKCDYSKIKDICWDVDSDSGYVKTILNNKKVYLHRYIFDKLPTNCRIDHIKTENRFDCRRSNLRITDATGNARNSKINRNNKSGFTGVYWNSKKSVWEASITVNYQKIHLGYYKTKKEAITVRREAENKYFGEFGYHNSQKIYKQNNETN